MTDDPPAADDTADYIAVRRLQNRYADIVTRRAWSELHDLMTPGCTLDLDLGDRQLAFAGPDAIGAFIDESIQRFSFFHFVPLTTVMDIDVAAGRADARLWMVELRQDAADGRRTDAYGLYRDRLERDGDGRWRLSARRYSSFSRTAEPGADVDQLIFPLPPDMGSILDRGGARSTPYPARKDQA
jgi:hypothetical protein